MHWKRFAQAFVLGTGISIVGAGCAAVNALVNSPAGQTAGASSPERLLAIGRVFENQGHLAKASAMYRQALKSDPSNSTARERLQYVAELNSGQSTNPADLRSRQAIAVADNVTRRKRGIRLRRSPIKKSSTATKQSNLATVLKDSSVIGSLTPVAAQAPADSQEQVIQPAVSIDTTSDDLDSASTATEYIEIVDTGWELAANQSEAEFGKADTGVVAITTDGIVDIETVDFTSDTVENGEITVAVATNVAESNMEWVSTSRDHVTLEETMRYMQDPEQHLADLLNALRYGEHEGVQALAATVLADCEQQKQRVNDALLDACGTESQLLQVTARDALVIRGEVDQSSIEHLLLLLTSEDADVRSQAAASLRNLNHSEWADSCVEGLGELLFDSKPQVIALAAATLGDFGKTASSYDAVLAELATSDDDLIRQACIIALQRIQ